MPSIQIEVIRITVKKLMFIVALQRNRKYLSPFYISTKYVYRARCVKTFKRF